MIPQKNGFTLLEIIIVLIILGVIASLAIPRFYKVIESSKSKEALESLSILRRAMERCYLIDHSFVTCDSLSVLDVQDPGTAINTHFTYAISSVGQTTFSLLATRNTYDNGDGASSIAIDQSGVKTGTGVFSGIR